MSISFEIQDGKTSEKLPMSSNCVNGITSLRQRGLEAEFEKLGLGKSEELGVRHIVNRLKVIEAVTELLNSVPNLPHPFQVRVTGLSGTADEHAVRSVSGLVIKGRQYAVICEYDKWKLVPMRISDVSQTYSDVSETRYGTEPAEILTENYGTVTVERIKGRSDLEVFLRRLQRFVSSSTSESFRVIVG